MRALRIAFLLITVNVVAHEANKTLPALPEPKNFKFEDQPSQSYGLVRFEGQDQEFDGSQNTIDEQRIKFETDNQDNRFQQYDIQNIEGQQYDNQNIEGQKIKFEDKRNQRPNQQKKKRRRRPKRLPNGAQGFRYPAQQYPGSPVYSGVPIYPGPPVFGPLPIYPGQRPYQPYTLYKPRPSATSAALSAVTEALTSLALYDDAQCVPRLLCEAAGGGTIPGSGILQSVAGLQPLLTLLSAYNGISSSPLFVFGRAVFLGMTSKANPGTCRYAYPQCPNDPEQLVHYLNNHNGGFFRFFAAPQLNEQQGLEQFYNQLSGQNYGLYHPQQPSQPNQYQDQNSQQGYGLQQQNQYIYDQQFGQYHHQYVNQQHQNPNLQDYGLHQQFHQNYQRPNPYGNGYGLNSQNSPYQKNLNQSSIENRIQKRIQNVRNTVFVNVSSKPKWSFPESASNRDVYSNVRLGKVINFPQNVNSIIAGKDFVFPGIQSNREYLIDSIEAFENNFEQKGVDGFKFFNQNNDGTFKDGRDDINNDDVRVLYVVRGNGDPNHPEIVRLSPGQAL
ncbi:uncharacterized protein LOC134746702 [Cydia strobilella]|uniref:uncharacterized protein LOC134746702 n=1 Tax=Cydia strobilella TaxID=1100964 RepID=UPI0030050545